MKRIHQETQGQVTPNDIFGLFCVQPCGAEASICPVDDHFDVGNTCCPAQSNTIVQRYDTEVYKWRHLVENYFAKIKEFRGIATRYDKTESSYTASWHLAAALIASR